MKELNNFLNAILAYPFRRIWDVNYMCYDSQGEVIQGGHCDIYGYVNEIRSILTEELIKDKDNEVTKDTIILIVCLYPIS